MPQHDRVAIVSCTVTMHLGLVYTKDCHLILSEIFFSRLMTAFHCRNVVHIVT